MRKIESSYEKKKKQVRNQWIVGIILVFLMVTSTLGFAFQGGFDSDNANNSEKLIYNGFEFENINGLWFLGNFIFRYNPQEVEDVGLILLSYSDFQGKPLYIYSENYEAELELSSNLKQIAERIQGACPENKICKEEIPIKTCENNFIILEVKEQENLFQEGNCVYIQGSEENLIKLSDQFLFRILGVR